MNFLKDIRERFRKYSALRRQQSEQQGEGVLTRRQAKLAVSTQLSKNEQDLNEASQPESAPMEVDESDAGQEGSESLNVTDNEIPVVLDQNEPEQNEPLQASVSEPNDSLFNQETLVAENQSLEAYVIKVFFKRQKRFQ